MPGLCSNRAVGLRNGKRHDLQAAPPPHGTFQAAIAAGATEVHCLNSWNYGPVTISGSITIDCGTGNVGTVSVNSNTAIVISTNSSATVVLRHLNLNGNGTASVGINSVVGCGSRIIEDCTIQGFAGAGGIGFQTSSGRGSLLMSNSRILQNRVGIAAAPVNSQIASVTLNRVEVLGNSTVGVDLGSVDIQGGVGICRGDDARQRRWRERTRRRPFQRKSGLFHHREHRR